VQEERECVCVVSSLRAGLGLQVACKLPDTTTDKVYTSMKEYLSAYVMEVTVDSIVSC